MPSNHLILCRPLFLLPSVFPSIRVFSNESVLCIRWTKDWSFSIRVLVPFFIVSCKKKKNQIKSSEHKGYYLILNSRNGAPCPVYYPKRPLSDNNLWLPFQKKTLTITDILSLEKKALKISTKNKHTHSWIETDTSDDLVWTLCQAFFGE